MKQSRNTVWLLGAALFIIAAQVYVPTAGQGFANWDDPKHIEVIWPPGLERAYAVFADVDLKSTELAYYHPLSFMGLMLEQAAIGIESGPKPWIAKLSNTLHHALICVLVYILLMSMGLESRGAFLGGLLFALHPLQVGTVAWISERKNLLMALFHFSGLLCFLRYLSSPRPWLLLLMTVLFACGVLSKPGAVMFPASAALWLIVVEKRRPSPLLMFTLISLTVGAVVWGLYAASTEMPSQGALPDLWLRPLFTAGALFFYAGKVLLPLNLVPVYPLWDIERDLPLMVIAAGAVLFVCAAIIRNRERIDPLILFGLGFAVLNILPVSGLVSFGYMAHSHVADHFMYTPMLGVALIFGRIVDIQFAKHADSKNTMRLLIAATYSVIAIIGILSIRQCLVWRNPETMWAHNVLANRLSPTVWCNYGVTLLENGHNEDAVDAFTRAVELAPLMDAFYSNLAIAYRKQEKWEDARRVLETALGLNPNSARNYRLLSDTLRKLGRGEDALTIALIGHERLPGSTILMSELGESFATVGREDEAALRFQECMALDPKYSECYARAAALLLRRGDAKEAASVLEKAEAAGFFDIVVDRPGRDEEIRGDLILSRKATTKDSTVRDRTALYFLNRGDKHKAEEVCRAGRESGHPCSPELMKSGGLTEAP